MNLRILYLAHAVITLILALALLLMTPVMLNLLGLENTRDTTTLTQLLAAALMAIGLTTLASREVQDRSARSAINSANLVAGVLGFVICLNATLTGVFGWFGWVMILFYALSALAFAYFQFLAPYN